MTSPFLRPGELAYLTQLAQFSLFSQFSDQCVGALIVDRWARVTWMNDSYPRRLGLESADAVVGQPVESVLPHSQMREVVETGRAMLLDVMEFGGDSFVVLRLPLRDPGSGEVVGALGLLLLDDAKGLAPLVQHYHQRQSRWDDSRRRVGQPRQARHTLSSIVGVSDACLKVKAMARRVARAPSPVLILGETGTGKELLAQAIHNASHRADQAFVAVNIAAVPETLLEAEFFGAVAGAYTGADRRGREGKFKLAEGGTLFLDEVGDMPAALQSKLLRVLQEGEFEPLGSDRLQRCDVRIIAATSRDLKEEVAQGRFRADLYYRLNVVSLAMPPLRDRLVDLPLLCESLLAALAERLCEPTRTLTEAALAHLAQHPWPGNVRELQNVLERALLMTDAPVLDASHFDDEILALAVPADAAPEAPTALRPLGHTLADAERQAIQQALDSTAGNKSKAASLLGISRTTLYERLDALRIV